MTWRGFQLVIRVCPGQVLPGRRLGDGAPAGRSGPPRMPPPLVTRGAPAIKPECGRIDSQDQLSVPVRPEPCAHVTTISPFRGEKGERGPRHPASPGRGAVGSCSASAMGYWRLALPGFGSSTSWEVNGDGRPASSKVPCFDRVTVRAEMPDVPLHARRGESDVGIQSRANSREEDTVVMYSRGTILMGW